MASENARSLLTAIDGAPKLSSHGRWVESRWAREDLGWSVPKFAAVVKRAIDAGLVEVEDFDGMRAVRATDKGEGARTAADTAETHASSNEAGRVSAIVGALEELWAAIQRHHNDLPDAQIVVATGNRGKKGAVNGHWHAKQWQGVAEHEVLIASERLGDGAAWVAETLLHEACHGIAFANEIQDTSRQGRWHNARFKAIAEAVGLLVEADKRCGYVTVGMTDECQDRYAAEVMVLEAAIGSSHRPRVVADVVPPKAKPRIQWRKALETVWMGLDESQRADMLVTLADFDGIEDALNALD